MTSTIEADQRIKIGLLATGVVVVFGFIVWQVVNAGGASFSEPIVAVSTTPQTQPRLATPSQEDANLIEIPALFASAGTNPFRTVIQPVIPKATVAKVAPQPRSLISTEVPAWGPRPLGVDVRAIPDGSIESMGIRAEGVIVGGDSVAVIRVADKSFVVKSGEVFGDGLKAESITTSEVVISKGKQKLALPVASGGAQK